MAGLAGLVAGVVPMVSAVVVFLDPLRHKTAEGKWVPIASLAAVPPDGKPRRFQVITDRWDAWNYYPPEPIGSVYLLRKSDSETPIAFSTVCPHLGCSVDYKPAQDEFLCPCHNSAFNEDGTRVDPETSPSPRGLDTLEVKLEGQLVLVDYRRFEGGKSEKIPV